MHACTMAPQSMPSVFTAFEHACNINVAKSHPYSNKLPRTRNPSTWCPLWSPSPSDMVTCSTNDQSSSSGSWCGVWEKRRRLGPAPNDYDTPDSCDGITTDGCRHSMPRNSQQHIFIKVEPVATDDHPVQSVTGSPQPYSHQHEQQSDPTLPNGNRRRPYLDPRIRKPHRPSLPQQHSQQQQMLQHPAWQPQLPPQQQYLPTIEHDTAQSLLIDQSPANQEDIYNPAAPRTRSNSPSKPWASFPPHIPFPPVQGSSEAPGQLPAAAAARSSSDTVGATSWHVAAPTITTGAGTARPAPVTTGVVGKGVPVGSGAVIATGAPGTGASCVTGAVVMTSGQPRPDHKRKRLLGIPPVGVPTPTPPSQTWPSSVQTSAGVSVGTAAARSRSPTAPLPPTSASLAAAAVAVAASQERAVTTFSPRLPSTPALSRFRPMGRTVSTSSSVKRTYGIFPVAFPENSGRQQPSATSSPSPSLPSSSLPLPSLPLPSTWRHVLSGSNSAVASGISHIPHITCEVMEDAAAPATPPRSPGVRATAHPPPQVTTQLPPQLNLIQPTAGSMRANKTVAASAPQILGFQMLRVELASTSARTYTDPVAAVGLESETPPRRGQIVHVVLRLSPLICGSPLLTDATSHGSSIPSQAVVWKDCSNSGGEMRSAQSKQLQQEQQVYEQERPADIWPRHSHSQSTSPAATAPLATVAQQFAEEGQGQQHQQEPRSETMAQTSLYGVSGCHLQNEIAQWQHSMEVQTPETLESHHHHYGNKQQHPLRQQQQQQRWEEKTVMDQHPQDLAPFVSSSVATTMPWNDPGSPELQPAEGLNTTAPSLTVTPALHGWLPSDAVSTPALPGLDRLLCAAAAAAAAAATVAEPCATSSRCPSALAALEVPAVNSDAYFEPDGTLLRGAVLRTACTLIRLAKLLRGGLSVVLPWCEPEDVNSATGGSGGNTNATISDNANAAPAGCGGTSPVPFMGRNLPLGTFGKLGYGPMGIPHSVLAAAASSGQRSVPLATVLTVLAEFCSAARALQQAEARIAAAAAAAAATDTAADTAAMPETAVGLATTVTATVTTSTEDYRALWNLMRRGRKCADALMGMVERVLTGGTIGSTSPSLAVSTKRTDVTELDTEPY